MAATRGRLLGERAARTAAERRAARLRDLHLAALALAGPAPSDRDGIAALLGHVVSYAVSALGGRHGELALEPDPAWDALVLATGPRPGRVVFDHEVGLVRRRLAARGTAAHACRTGQIVSVANTQDEGRFDDASVAARRGLGSLAVAPLIVAGRVVGVLTIARQATGALDDEDRELLHLLAMHAAAAVDRVRLAAAARGRTWEAEQLAAVLARVRVDAERDVTKQRLSAQAEEVSKRGVDSTALHEHERDRLTTDLLGTISHELRTPLTVVYGQAQRLKRHAQLLQTIDMESMADHIISGSRQLGRLVEDLLEFTRLERGEVALRPTDFDAVPVLEELLESLQAEFAGRLMWELPGSLRMHADAARLTQVVTNLVENARKYAPEGPILVRGLVSAGGAVRIEVVDEGPGITSEEQQRVWEKLYRGQHRPTTSRGSGIGLAVVKTLVDVQGGRVGLESTPGQGARFWFELPASLAAGAAA